MFASDPVGLVLAAVDQYNAQQAGITAAIVIAVLIPVGCCIVCLFLRLRQNVIEQRQSNNYASNTVYKPTTTNAANDRNFTPFQQGGTKNFDFDTDDTDSYNQGPYEAREHTGDITYAGEPPLQKSGAPLDTADDATVTR